MNPTTNGYMLEVKSLSKKFGEFPALKDLNFQIPKGEILGFLGPNGAGKTTTMRIITCYIPASSGTVLVDGLETVANSLRVRQKIGYLAETNPLYSDMTVREYLNFVGEIRGLRQPKLGARIDEMFSICGLTKMAERQIGKLSKGFRQRVGLAQSMMHNPDLLILDEPMSGLDPNQIVEIRQLIKKIGAEKTVIYCSHILSEVSATCSRIIIINEGQIVASGTAGELTARSSRGNRYTVTVRADRDAAQSALQGLPNVAGVSIKGVSKEWATAEVLCASNEDIGEDIFRCVVSKGWSLSELRHETASLEDVFTQLTRG
ncbi:MAG: ATP-binding cassette domain-containing protein [Chitinispirillaceae bacterium]|nr:ATP-binding cassette domain-containing protein [Chitinispirillaceae bacterium]